MSINRRELLMGGAALMGSALFLPRRAQAQMRRPKRLIVVFAAGGWDPVANLDPKDPGPGIDIPPGQRVRAGGIEVFDAEGTESAVPNFFERHGDVAATVHGITVASVAHDPCTIRILTGTPTAQAPDMGAVSAAIGGSDLPLPYMVLGGTAFTGPYTAQSGRLGNSNQIVTTLDPARAFPVLGQAQPPTPPSAAESEAVQAFLQNRAARLRDHRGRFGQNRQRIEDFVSSLRTSSGLTSYSEAFGDVTPSMPLGQQIDIALDMLAQNVVWSIGINSGVSWDTHDNNHRDQAANNLAVFTGLSALVDGLKSRPGSMGGRLIDETSVVVVSEMGRTPTLNNDAGKDHWQTTSAIVIGSDIGAGRSYGKSTDTGDEAGVLQSAPVDFATGDPSGAGRPVESANFVAGVLGWVGGQPERFLPGDTPFMPWVRG
jgi:hypothetical protein